MSIDPIQLTEDLHRWEAAWDSRLVRWVSVNRDEQPDFTRMIEHTTSLLRLVVNLIKDPHLVETDRQKLFEVALYVLNADDRIPESQLGVVGLVDDAIFMAGTLNDMVGLYSPQIRINWIGEGEILDIIEHIYENRDSYLAYMPSKPESDREADEDESSV